MIFGKIGSPGFSTDVENMGGAEPLSPIGAGAPQTLIWGLCQKMGGAWEELKILSKNTCEGVHLIVKLPPISLQTSNFTKN